MKWKDKNIVEKIAFVMVNLCSLAVIVMAVLQLTGVWEDAANVYIPAAGVNLVFVGVSSWRTSRAISVVNMAAAAFMFVCSAVVLFLK